MYDSELEKVKKQLRRLARRNEFDHKHVWLFGVSENTRKIIHILRELGIDPSGVIDNDLLKQGSFCSRVKVRSISEIDEIPICVFVICSAYWREMVSHLRSLGVRHKQIFNLMKRRTVFHKLISSCRGFAFFRYLRKKYGDSPIFLCPYTGTGDIYLIGTFWGEYCRRNGIERYVFLVLTGACKKVASLFDIENVEACKKKKQAEWLIDAHLLFPNQVKIKLLNDCWAQIHANQIEWFRGFKRLHFTEMFRRFVFDLPENVLPVHPQYKNEDSRIAALFEENHLIYKKTVILSPYSNTLADLPNEFWPILASRLRQRGYVVCTNCGDPTEKGIRGTIPLFFSLDIAPQVLESAGYFIGVRSGFCDIISGTKSQKIVLYDAKNRFYMGSAFEYFSLKQMGLSEDVIEIEYHWEQPEKLAEMVMDKL